ncbi:sigma-54-dependent transcriptional regulator [Desulfonema magnum]|uniref:Two component system response regulator, sigma factor 54 interaction domain-containing n=1 Tax=Desulfonema magnum TaxID=45655 RepID=A0A975GR53_9BACT|nr:sigma-54 dependent transcriptional regulator [Desulfonema magnum]QTA90686.1 Two component system response regulator, sigma factor 54 interaction domain-containing [Desulfonema magnum]
MFPSIMIIDDEPSIRQSLSGILSDEGFDVITASNGYEALKIIDSESPDLVLLDIWMPGIDGIETLKEIKKNNAFIQVVIITGHGTIETAVKATKLGAFDLIEKPLSIDKVIVTINNALNFRRLEEENKYLRKKTIEKNAINGNSPLIAELKKQVAIAAPTDSWILITGENGTGKELVARTIHQLSTRSDQPLIDVNCAAIPDEQIEIELFGQEKGFSSEMSARKRGKFEMANSGTLFLDEIGDMSLRNQAKILRVLQEQKFQRTGGDRMISVDVRVIAASNKDLENEIKKGNFREELYYRLNVVPIEVPPLRNRLEDIPILVETFLTECADHHHTPKKRLTEKALKTLCNYSWPGNVRELKNFIGRLAIMVEKQLIDDYDISVPCNPGSEGNTTSAEAKLFSIARLEEAKKIFEKEFIQRKLVENQNDIDKTAQIIGTERSYLEKKLGIKN